MIVRMKRLTLLCLTIDRDAALDELRDARRGARHRPAPAGRRGARGAARPARRRGAGAGGPARGQGRRRRRRRRPPRATAAEDVVAEVLALLDRRDALAGRAEELRRELARYAGFGEFDLRDGARARAQAGVATLLASAPPGERPAAPDGTVLTELGRDGDGEALRPRRARRLAGRPARPRRPLRRRPLAASARSPTLRDELAADAAESGRRRAVSPSSAAARDAVAALVQRDGRPRPASRRCAPAWTRPASSPCSPATCRWTEQDAVRAAAAAHGWGILLDDPEPGEDVPVQLQAVAAGWRPCAPCSTSCTSTRATGRADVGWVFLPFFSLFFAMIVGDAGYADAAPHRSPLVLQRRLKKVPAHVFHMMYIVGFATLVWGVHQRAATSASRRCRGSSQQLEVAWLADRDNLIDLCFLIGAVHLSFAHVWNAVSFVRERAWTKVRRAGGLAARRVVDVLHRPPAVLGRGAPGLPAADAARPASSSCGCS